jgi:hypothetical protein
MASKSAAVRHAVSDYSNACKDPSAVTTLEAAAVNLATARIEDFIVRTLATAPPVSIESRRRLARLLVQDDPS